MRIFILVLSIVILVSPAAYCDVRLHGDLVVTKTSAGARYMGEILNDTDSTITDVKVTVTVRNTSSTVIDLADGFVDGYTDLNSGSDASIPPGNIAPFVFSGDAGGTDSGTPEVSVSYNNSDALLDLNAVTLAGELNIVPGLSGSTFYGDIVNNSPTSLYYARIMIALKDSTGNLVNMRNAYVQGENYLASGMVYTDTLIQPGESAPFQVGTSLAPDAFESYYTIITFTTGPEQSYEYFGAGEIDVAGGVIPVKVSDKVVYQGEIENGTDKDIYLVNITFVTRDASNRIIHIDTVDVNGTFYEISDGFITETHIAPGAYAPFEVETPVAFSEIASYEYRIHYRYSDRPVSVESSAPPAFALDQNAPNPFNPDTTIAFTLAQDAPVVLRIYNSGGQLIEELLRMNLAEGTHDVTWDGSRYPSGTYIYELSAAGQAIRKKMTLLK